MSPKIVTLTKKKLVGMQSTMQHGQFGKIVALWKSFMPRRKEIKNVLNNDFFAMQIYSDFNDFEKPYAIYACVEISSIDGIPEYMESFSIPEGEYAVFLHKGMNASETYQKIMTKWLPNRWKTTLSSYGRKV